MNPVHSSFTRGALLSATAAALLLTGCANMSETQRNTAIGAGIGALGGYAWSHYMENKRAQMQQATAGTGVQVTQTADNQLKLNVPNDISFATNSAAIEPRLRPILDQFAQGLGQQPGMQVSIVGYTDSTGNDAINNPLSLERANSVRDYLAGRGVNPGIVRTEGRGSHDPIASNATEAGRAQNRRVEIYLAERATANR